MPVFVSSTLIVNVHIAIKQSLTTVFHKPPTPYLCLCSVVFDRMRNLYACCGNAASNIGLINAVSSN